ncbi:MAG: hypothetical protein HFI26_16765 [Lachnospiraceae bacterium]|nr:hypothetical protein [Lachnospiraceae bacterium]
MESGRETGAETESGMPGDKTIQMIIPFGAGGDTDLHCRVLTDPVSKELGGGIVCTKCNGNIGNHSRQTGDGKMFGYYITPVCRAGEEAVTYLYGQYELMQGYRGRF